MLHIASTMINRARQTKVSLEDVLTHRQYNAYGKPLPKGVNQYRTLAQKALKEVQENGPVTAATFYATPNATKNLPKGLKAIGETFGHKYFSDPKNRAIETRLGTRPVSAVADVAAGPWGAGPAKAYAQAQYQRAMPSGPTPPATAPVPSSRPLDSIGGLGALAVQGSRVAPSSLPAPARERFEQGSLASAPSPSRFGAVTAQDDMPMQAQPRSPPMGVVSGPLGPVPTRPMDQSQRFRPSAAPAAIPTPTARPAYTPAPAPAAAQMATDPAKMYAYAGLSRSLAPATPVGQKPATVATAAPQTRSIAPAPAAAPAPIDRVKATPMAQQPASPPLGAVNAPLGPANAPPAALSAARNLGAAMAAAAPEMATPATLAEKVSQPAARQVAAVSQVAQQAQQRPAGGLPAGVAGPWGANISMQQQPAVDRLTTQSTAQQPTTFGQKLGNFAQRSLPAIAGTMIAGPVGGMIGGLLGRSLDAAKPGQVFGNPFQGLGNTAKAMGMFQSGTPYSGPISNYGTGLRAIGDVLGGAAPVGSRAYSRSTPGYHVTALPGGTIQRTNQYGFTSFERPSMSPTGSSFPGGFGGFFGGGGQQSGKTSGGRTSGSKSSSGKSGGGRKSERSESAGY